MKKKINPSKKNLECTVWYKSRENSNLGPMTLHNTATFDLLRKEEMHSPHKCTTFCAWYVKSDGVHLRDPRNMKDIFSIRWKYSIDWFAGG